MAMTDDLAARLTAHARLVILRVLAETDADHLLRRLILRLLWCAPAYTLSLSVLTDVLSANGVKLGRDRIAVAAGWLAEQRLCNVVAGDVPALALTNRGHDVADGAANCPGVSACPDITWLRAALASAAINLSDGDIAADLGYLRAHDLIHMDDGVILLTAAGGEVVAGRRRIDGVHVPSPASIMAAGAQVAMALLVRGR